jgi:hypothetical protein
MSKNHYRPVIQKALSSKVNIEKKYYGYLGSGLDVAVPGRPGYVYVTLNDGMVIIAYNQAVPPTLNYPVVVGYDPNQTSKHTLVVLGTRTIPREGSTDNNTFAVAPHHASHEFGNSNGGNDIVYVHTRQLLPLRPTPTGGFNLHIYSDIQKISDVWTQVGGITLDLSAHQQTGFVSGSAGDSKWVLISLSLTSGSIIQTSGSVKAIGVLSASDLPVLPAQSLPICAIRFWSGQTEIFEGYTGTDLLDLRMTKKDDGALSGLTDVEISGSQSVGQVLTWISGSPGYWAPTSISGSSVNHNDLLNIQGGVSTERYHLTSAELTKLQALSGSAAGASANEPFLTAGSSALLTNYRELKPGTNMIFDYSIPNELSISGSGGGVTTLAGLSDVEISGSQSVGQALVWNGIKWNPDTVSGSGYTESSATGWVSMADTLTYVSADTPIYVLGASRDVSGIYSPGMKLKWSQSGSTAYGILHAVSGSQMSVYCGTDYSVSGSGAITLPYYSMQRAPFGFPMNPAKWTVEVKFTAGFTQITPTQNVWYNATSIGLPIGCWRVYYEAIAYISGASASTFQLFVTLSTANNSEADVDFTSWIYGNAIRIEGSIHREKVLNLAAKATWYLNLMTPNTSASALYVLSTTPTILRAVNAYL